MSSISSLIVSEITENPKAKYVKFLFCATLLIKKLIPGAHVSSSSRFLFSNLSVLQIMQLFLGVSVIINVLNMKLECIQSLDYQHWPWRSHGRTGRR